MPVFNFPQIKLKPEEILIQNFQKQQKDAQGLECSGERSH